MGLVVCAVSFGIVAARSRFARVVFPHRLSRNKLRKKLNNGIPFSMSAKFLACFAMRNYGLHDAKNESPQQSDNGNRRHQSFGHEREMSHPMSGLVFPLLIEVYVCDRGTHYPL